jgi:CRP-like cAMP-binding protein
MDDGTVGGGVINDGTRDALIEELQATFLFAPFSEEELYWLVAHAEVVSVAPGGHVFTERQPPDVLWVLLSGEWRLGRTVGARHVVVGMSSTPGVWAGWLPVIERLALEVQVTRPSRLLRIPHTAVEHMLMSGYPIACHLITGIYQGVQNIMMQTRQQEKMIALGKLSAGLAHRLNNPAAAARSAATDLRRVLSQGQAPPVFRATDGRPNDTAVAPTGGLQDLMRECDTHGDGGTARSAGAHRS